MTNVVYIHKGYSWYVPLALLNGGMFCSGNVNYLGDAFGCRVASWLGASAYRIKDFNRSAERFARIYRHHSELGADFELFCIQRWFILTEFMEMRGIESCVYLDTDVLLTRNIDADQARTSNFDLTYCGYSAHVCFVNRFVAIQRFCSFVSALYADPASEERLNQWHRDMVAHSGGGGVSDMTLFYWFQKENPDVLGDYPSIFGDSPFDVALDETRGFQSDEDGFKRLLWAKGHPSAIAADGRRIDLASLHHQGRGKCRLMKHSGRLGVGLVTRSILAPAAGVAYGIAAKLTRLRRKPSAGTGARERLKDKC